jgi:hypothetical protein
LSAIRGHDTRTVTVQTFRNGHSANVAKDLRTAVDVLDYGPR